MTGRHRIWFGWSARIYDHDPTRRPYIGRHRT